MSRLIPIIFALVVALCFGTVDAKNVKKATYLGQASANRYAPNSVANKYGVHGSRYSNASINNPYSVHGSRYSPTSANNPYATKAPVIYAQDGTYLGRLSSNRYDPLSVSNPYGVHGSRYSPVSVNNPYGAYGSRHSPYSVTNPYTQSAPSIFSVE
jgi:hypothetical protein